MDNNNIIHALKGFKVAGIPTDMLEFIVFKAMHTHYETEYQFWLSVMGNACKAGVLTFADKLLGLRPPEGWLETEEDFVEFLKAHPVGEYVKAGIRLSHFWSLPVYPDLELEDGTAWPDIYRKAKALHLTYSFRRDVRFKLWKKYLPWHELYKTLDNPDENQLAHYIDLFIADLEEDLQKKA